MAPYKRHFLSSKKLHILMKITDSNRELFGKDGNGNFKRTHGFPVNMADVCTTLNRVFRRSTWAIELGLAPYSELHRNR